MSWSLHDGLAHGRAGGVSLLLDARGSEVPMIVHWGADLGAEVDLAALVRAVIPPVPPGALDTPVLVGLLP